MSIKTIDISTGYSPRPLQIILHNSLKRFNVVVAHRRFGKTIFSLNELIDKALRCTLKNPQFAYIAPNYGQAKRVAWDALKEFTRNIPGMIANEAELKVEIPRPYSNDKIRIMLLGAENPGSIRGIYLDGCILDEFSEFDPVVWTQVVRPALSDRLGWAIFIGTPKGQNGFYEIYQKAQEQKDWFTALYKASETGIIPVSELEAAKAIMSPEEYDQEYECSFSAALVGAYYGKHMAAAEEESRITGVAHDPAVSVSTFFDLGIDDTTVIWFGQRVGKNWHWIDHLEMSGEGLDFYVKELEKRKSYKYDMHYLPHDAAARDLGTGKTRVETLNSLGITNRYITVLPKHELEDGINAVRMLIPKSWFDREKCKRGIEALRAYERKWDTKNKIYQQKPLHNWASHSADAFRIAAMSNAEGKKSDEDKKRYPRKSQADYDIFGR